MGHFCQAPKIRAFGPSADVGGVIVISGEDVHVTGPLVQDDAVVAEPGGRNDWLADGDLVVGLDGLEVA